MATEQKNQQPQKRKPLSVMDLLITALTFYADPENWVNGRCMGDRGKDGLRPRDDGRIARQTLEYLEAEGKKLKERKEEPKIVDTFGRPILTGAR